LVEDFGQFVYPTVIKAIDQDAATFATRVRSQIARMTSAVSTPAVNRMPGKPLKLLV
jgi:hypothetical protein